MALDHIKIPQAFTKTLYNVTTPVSALVIPWAFFEPADIVVIWEGATRVLNVDYTVQGTPGFDRGFPGGYVSFPAPQSNKFIEISRHVPVERTVDFPPSGPLQTNSLNTQLDKIVAMIQDTNGEVAVLDNRVDILEKGDPRLGRAMLFPPEDIAIGKTLPAISARSERTLGFALDGNIAMRSAITLPDSVHDEVLPAAAGRINKVLGWDATGHFVNLVEVVAGAIVPNADNISYQAGSGTVVRNVGDVLRERLSIKDFGTGVGEGVQATDDAALAAAITYINAAPGAGLTLFYPAGVYFHGPCPVKLTRLYCTIEGDGTNSAFVVFTGPGTWITIGNQATPATATENIGFRNFTLQLQSTTGRFFLLENTVNVRFENIRLVSADIFVTLGVIGAGPTTAYHTYIRNCGGTSRNTGAGLIQCRYGGGLYIDLCNFAIDSAAGAGASGKNFIEFRDSVNFVVVRVTTCFVVNYYAACFCDLIGGGTIADILFVTCSLVNLGNFGFYLNAPGGSSIVGVRSVACAMNTPNGTCVWLSGGGRNDEHNFISNGFLEAGGSAIAGNTSALHIVISGNRIKNCNRLNIAEGAIHITSGSGFNITDNVGNDAESTSRAPWGIIMGAGMDRYLVSNNRIGGTTGSIRADLDGVASHLRRIVNNGFCYAGFNGYAIIAQAGLDASGNVTNTTPFVCDAIVSGSGFLGATSINGIPIGDATTGTFHLEPGDTLTVQATAPAVTIRRYE